MVLTQHRSGVGQRFLQVIQTLGQTTSVSTTAFCQSITRVIVDNTYIYELSSDKTVVGKPARIGPLEIICWWLTKEVKCLPQSKLFPSLKVKWHYINVSRQLTKCSRGFMVDVWFFCQCVCQESLQKISQISEFDLRSFQDSAWVLVFFWCFSGGIRWKGSSQGSQASLNSICPCGQFTSTQKPSPHVIWQQNYFRALWTVGSTQGKSLKTDSCLGLQRSPLSRKDPSLPVTSYLILLSNNLIS